MEEPKDEKEKKKPPERYLEREIKEIHQTRFINKELPSVSFEKSSQKSFSESEHEYVRVTDDTSEKALETLCKLKLFQERDKKKGK